jgi:hypothetical protein
VPRGVLLRRGQLAAADAAAELLGQLAQQDRIVGHNRPSSRVSDAGRLAQRNNLGRVAFFSP